MHYPQHARPSINIYSQMYTCIVFIHSGSNLFVDRCVLNEWPLLRHRAREAAVITHPHHLCHQPRPILMPSLHARQPGHLTPAPQQQTKVGANFSYIDIAESVLIFALINSWKLLSALKFRRRPSRENHTLWLIVPRTLHNYKEFNLTLWTLNVTQP